MPGTRWQAGNLIFRSLVYLGLIGWSIVCAFPLYWLLISSFKLPIEFVGPAHYIPFLDFQPSLHAWTDILTSPGNEVLLRFMNSAIVAIGSTALTITTGSCAAFGSPA